VTATHELPGGWYGLLWSDGLSSELAVERAGDAASVVSGCAAQRGTGSAATAPEAIPTKAQLVLRDYISVEAPIEPLAKLAPA